MGCCGYSKPACDPAYGGQAGRQSSFVRMGRKEKVPGIWQEPECRVRTYFAAHRFNPFPPRVPFKGTRVCDASLTAL